MYLNLFLFVLERSLVKALGVLLEAHSRCFVQGSIRVVEKNSSASIIKVFEKLSLENGIFFVIRSTLASLYQYCKWSASEFLKDQEEECVILSAFDFRIALRPLHIRRETL